MKLSGARIKAFTIAEMLVVLILSSILILMAMSVLNLVQKQMKSIEKNFEINNTTRSFERLLWKDFNLYDMYFDRYNDCLVGKNPKDSVCYRFYDDYVVRNTDTLAVEVLRKSLYLEAEKVNTGRIDALELELSQSQRGMMLFCFQTEDASYYIHK